MKRYVLGVLVGALGLAGCQELVVPNENSPSIDQVFNNGEDLESAIGTSFRIVWGVSQGARTNSTYPVLGLAAVGEELTSANLYPHNVASEPRTALDNRDAGGWHNRKPWYDLYEAIATTSDALIAMEKGVTVGAVSAARPQGLRAGRAKVFAKMIQGMSHIYVGLLFDKGFTRDETMPADASFYQFKDYKQVTEFGIAKLQEAIQLANTLPLDTLPANWINGVTPSTRDLIPFMNTMIARALAYVPRSPEERAAVDWAKVIQFADAGVKAPFGQQASSSITGTSSTYVQYTQLQTDGRVDNHIVGPADTSGAYQRWLTTPLEQKTDFQVLTPDKRIHATGAPTTRGTIVGYLATQTQPSTRGTYMWSRYRGMKYGTTYYNTGFIETTNPKEMAFLKAEAAYRLNDRATTVAILNATRVPAGLKPVTVDGPPPGSDCVPRRQNGACGNLFDALMYEKRIELFGLEPIIPYADYRGWGRVPKGTMVNMPVHGRELETIGATYYSFGGDLPGSAPEPKGPFGTGW